MKKLCVLALWLIAIVFLVPATAHADTISQAFSHNLSSNEPAQSWEHKIDLPDNLNQQGFSFFRRAVTLTGKLVVEREELTSTYYYIKVRLPKAFFGSKGNVSIQLEAAKELPPCNPVPPPTELSIPTNSNPLNPDFSWKGNGKYSAITLYDVTANNTVWERIIPGVDKYSMTEGRLDIDHHFKWAVRQSDECARYSPETQAGFRLELRMMMCQPCFGRGWIMCTSCNGTGHILVQGPNGQQSYRICSWCNGSGRRICTYCNGSGRVQTPVLIVE
ncbi:MAG: zinc finger-like domain-containing protein [Candidatus Riflebacteria bacterium]|nr:zinc finger-like domain-containing protein [Candidatus Riflebacteria bacterium]